MRAVGAAFNFMTSVEMALTAPLGAIPFPAFPAVAMGAAGMGIPHAHPHPPNLVPPAPPVPFPHVTMLLKIPILSGAMTTMVAGKPAARCGDMGVEIWCGGYFPMCEVFLGSCNVWIEGARAARVGVDITKHCIFTTPKPSDPPLGPMVGMTMQPEMNVMIGGVPLPSLTSLAIGAAFKALFKGLGKLGAAIGRTKAGQAVANSVRNFRAQRYVNSLLRSRAVVLHGDDAFNAAARRDLARLAATRSGRELLSDLAGTGKRVDLHPPSHHNNLFPGTPWNGPYAMPQNYAASGLQLVPDNSGPFQQVFDPATGNRTYPNQRMSVRDVGPGSSTDIVYDPTGTHPNHGATPNSPSDVILGHEMNHARNNAHGRRANEIAMPDNNWQNSWQDLEEHNTVGFENQYRSERGLPPRPDYSVLP